MVRFLAALKYAEQITQTANCNSAVSGECSLTSLTYTLCTHLEHSFPPSPDRKTRSGVPVRPQLLSNAVFPCSFTGGSIGPATFLTATPSSVCNVTVSKPGR